MALEHRQEIAICIRSEGIEFVKPELVMRTFLLSAVSPMAPAPSSLANLGGGRRVSRIETWVPRQSRNVECGC